ncbi:MAG: dipeptide ABC transporter ATP-binding protein [Alphaproteobacteria bacterium]|nr:dipeptide ABC transporter ATP-binding protein [Alphaproteobacteria bacterium]
MARLLRRHVAFSLSAAVILAAVAAAIAAPFLGLVDPNAMEASPYLPPGDGHWLGTDNFGRDVLSRVVWGTRLALLVAIVSSAIASLLGIALGSLSGYFGGAVDAALSRTFDVFLLIPSFFLVLLIVALFGSGIEYTMIAIALTTWPRSARIMRAQVLSLKSRVHVQAARAAGASHARTLLRHVIPNGLAPIITDATILMGLAILTEAGLSFLGLGDQNSVSWGRMIFEGQRQLRLAPWMSIFPGAALLILVAAFNLLGDGLNQALSPQLRRLVARAVGLPPIEVPPTAPASDGPILAVRGLAMSYRLGDGEIRAVDGVSFELARGGSLGIVGESGCGKSSLGAALLQVMAPNATTTAGDVELAGRVILRDGRRATRDGVDAIAPLRWTKAAIIFQSAMNALNPVMTVGRQLADAWRLHRPDASRAQTEARVAAVFDLIGIPRARLDAYPHELSGGMRQRAMIALSLLHEPELVIADEPTTALDVLIQDQILGELDALRRRMGLSLILISHDMGAVAETCERVAVMYGGEIVELAPTARLFADPRHPYTRALLAALPSVTGARRVLSSLPGEPFVATGAVTGCRFAARCAMAQELCRRATPPRVQVTAAHEALCHFAAEPAVAERAAAPTPVPVATASAAGLAASPTPAPPLLEARDLTKLYDLRAGWFRAGVPLRAVDGIDLKLARGEILALVGESGSGKTTTGKLVTLQEQPSGGSLRFEGADVGGLSGAALKAYRRRVQMIFQNPYEALDPRHRLIDSVIEPLAIHGIGTASERRARAERMLEMVEMRPASRFAQRFPSDLSGGQLQRVAIARALVLEPALVVADEPVSMLDVSVRSGVMNLMLRLSRDLGLASLYITHDLAVARHMSTRIAVMYLGAIVEEGPTEKLVADAAHPYTRLLIAAVPGHQAARRHRVRLAGEAAPLAAVAAGCRFAPRCPLASEICGRVPPPRMALGPDHWSACHFAGEPDLGARLSGAAAWSGVP